MTKNQDWRGLPYYPISQFYQKTFGEKVWKVPVTTAGSCPNREGIRGMKTCNFCDVWGSAAYPEQGVGELREQIRETREKVRVRGKANKFLVYFQSYTSTFQKVSRLESEIKIAQEFDDVVGVVVGTRPDCLSESVFSVWNKVLETHFLSVELGVQTFDERQLLWMRRGHTAEKSIWGIKKIKEKCPKVDLGIHLMFGCPGETDEQLIESAKLINSLPVDNVKLHNIHVLKDTPLAKDYHRGLYDPLSRDEYNRRVVVFLQYLDPRIAVHRLTAVASRHDELVAPDWAASKMESYQATLDALNSVGAYQGQLFDSSQNELASLASVQQGMPQPVQPTPSI
jgi:radical SAM protein (TIGR01212 family)